MSERHCYNINIMTLLCLSVIVHELFKSLESDFDVLSFLTFDCFPQNFVFSVIFTFSVLFFCLINSLILN